MKKNPQDATRRNVQAANKKLSALLVRVKKLELAVLSLARKKALLLFLLALTTVGCIKQPPATLVTQRGRDAYYADQIVLRVNELQSATIEAQPRGLPLATARIIVQACIDANYTLRSVPAGWQATLRAGWREAKVKIIGLDDPLIMSAIAAVDALIEAIQIPPGVTP